MPAPDPIAIAREAAKVLAAEAARVDSEAAFPEAGLSALKESGLMGLTVPLCFGGMGASYETLSEAAQILAGSCLSTAMIWAMHCQQVAVLVDHASESLKERVLPRVARGGMFIASVTSEQGKGGHLLTAHAPIVWDGDEIALLRDAPVVTGGARADGYLITMRAGEDALPSDVTLVFADRAQLAVDIHTDWDSLGMRGTQSAGMRLEGTLPNNQVIGSPGGFKQIAVRTMIPVGHIAWASCWLGAAQRAYNSMLAVWRDPALRGGYNMQSDLFAERLARIRLQIDTVRATLESTVREYETVRDDGGCDTPAFNIRIGNLKILASELSFDAVDRLVQLAGLRFGYLKNDHAPLERIFRDLRSASLMYANDRLLVANGKLALIDREKL